MRLHKNHPRHVLFALFLLVALAACGGSPTSEPGTATPTLTETPAGTSATATPSLTPTTVASEPPAPTPTRAVLEPSHPTSTPTSVPLPVVTTPAPEPSRCDGLAGQLEVQVVVGPAEAVGLEPVAVGSVPFAVTSSGPPYLLQGQGHISYADILTQDWGTYAVTLEMDGAVQGDCSGHAGGEQLDLSLEMTGEQLVEVNAQGFHGEYPWSGTHTLELTFPLEEGASAEGEGWVIVLHLGSQ